MRPAPPRLRPGCHVVRRDDGHLQVGVDPPGRVILADRPEVVALLERLEDGLPPPTGRDGDVVARLRRAGLLRDDRPVRRGNGAVRLVPRGLELDPLADLLTAVGVRPVATGGEVAVVAATGPLPRDAVDPLVAEGTPHLVLTGVGRPGVLRVGPFVVPGQTACLRCVDAHEGEADPRRALVLEQLAERPAAPLGVATTALAAAWAVRDLQTYLAGGCPATWSASVDLDDAPPALRSWERHPHCGCAWDEVPY